jgi:hypothetical protein
MSQRRSEESMVRDATWLFSDGSPDKSLVAELSGMAAPDFVVDEIRSCRVFGCFGLSSLVTSRYLTYSQLPLSAARSVLHGQSVGSVPIYR